MSDYTPQSMCPECRTVFDDTGQTRCPACGVQFDDRGPAAKSYAATPTGIDRSNSALAVIALFATVGFGLGGGALLFLWAIGAFDSKRGLDDLGEAIFGGLAIAAVLVFAVMVGVVLAAVGGVYIGNRDVNRRAAAAAGALAGGLGHLALVVTLGGILLLGVGLVDTISGESKTGAAKSSKAVCEETFGPGSALCADESTDLTVVSTPTPSTGGSDVNLETVVKLALGIVPAALVGALTAAVFTRRGQHG